MRINLCDNCLKQVGCTIAAGRTETCAYFHEKPLQGTTVEIVFKKELSWFTHQPILNHVRDMFRLLCPEYFWYIPASVKGHHPPICQNRGGVVHHTKLAMRFAKEFCDMWALEMNEEEANSILAATLLHDMLKRGRTDNELETFHSHKEATRAHGRYCADRIIELGCAEPWEWEIARGVALHMGRWTWEITEPEKEELKYTVVRTVHAADYAASRATARWLAERHLDETMGYLQCH
jgi:hypothetical protein